MKRWMILNVWKEIYIQQIFDTNIFNNDAGKRDECDKATCVLFKNVHELYHR